LIFSKQRHRVLISSPLSPSQKERETNPKLMRICCSVAGQRNLTSMLLRLFAERQDFKGCNVDAWNNCWTIAFSQF